MILPQVEALANTPLILTVSPGAYGLAIINGLQIVRSCDFTINPGPGNQYVSPGDPVTFSVTVTVSKPVSYQWQLSGTNLPGATGATLTFLAISPD